MVSGRLRMQRWNLVAQAELVWADKDLDRKEFIESGSLGNSVIPFDPTIYEAMTAELTSGQQEGH